MKLVTMVLGDGKIETLIGLIQTVANIFWVKSGREYLWVKITAIVGVIATILILSSGGNYNIFGILGTFMYIFIGITFLLSIILYPFKTKNLYIYKIIKIKSN